jgi:hypothetical protein
MRPCGQFRETAAVIATQRTRAYVGDYWDGRITVRRLFAAFAPDLQGNGSPSGRLALTSRENSLTDQSNIASLSPVIAASVSAQSSSRTDREWSVAMFEASARGRGSSAVDHLLGVFDVLNDIINRADRPARAFLVRLGRVSAGPPASPDDQTFAHDLRTLITELAVEARVPDVENLMLSWWVLMKGTVLKALDGDLGSAIRGRAMAADLITRHSAPQQTFFPVAQSFADRVDFDAYFDWALTDES